MAWLRHVAPCIYSLIYTPVGEIQRKRMEKGQKKKKNPPGQKPGEKRISIEDCVSPNLTDDKICRNHRR